ncbi:penicillin-binding protein 1B [Thalassotalea ponticola]|uniref:penicillin-binding protein 1B n=1 Tax=Thalassotalea ponticola TaxID=1523392 RepID=UPI0025B2D21D|nr:penicillin-binding protein 1B [Thalassotalea ponticola]MDN3653476.1 penicillin-binding protein 1B [Thalassotalea ponticola]
MANKKSQSRTQSANSVSGQSKGHEVSRYLLVTAVKLSLIFITTFLLYAIYLDGKVRQSFEGQRWQVPAQVYGRVLTLDYDSQINLDDVTEELRYIGYQPVEMVRQPGQYSQGVGGLTVYRRPFDFGFGMEPATRIRIDVRDDTVFRLFVDDQQVHQVKLEPVLIDRITSSDGEDRVVLRLDQTPQALIDALLLVEDRNFYEHYGISPTGILRAFWKNLLAGEAVQGGSTLTQQLAKNMYLSRDKTIWRKVNEAMIAVILEQRYSKDQLLEAYINEVYLGQHFANGIHGFGLAAEFYFGKRIENLDASQLALLVGMVKGPSYYDPWRRPQRALERRDLVLSMMFQKHFFDSDTYQHLLMSPLAVRAERRMDKQKFPGYMQLVRRELKNMGAASAMQSGIRVFTGFNLSKQLNAERAVVEQLAKLSKQHDTDLQGAMVVSDVRSGMIEAIVAGKEAKFSGFNRALDAKRPIGSLIKPVVYLTALQQAQAYHFATPLDDKPIVLKNEQGDTWQPKNYDGKYRGNVPLLDALVYSLNVPTVNLGQQLGVNNVAHTLWSLGYDGDINQVPSLFLGAINMSPLEVNTWYNTIANHGLYNQTSAVDYVLSGDGEELWRRFTNVDVRISPKVAYLLDFALTKVAQQGTARSLSWRLPEQQVAGKTGTSNDGRDAWFVGYDQNSLVTTWVGRDDNGQTELTGSSGALPIFAQFMQQQGVSERLEFMPVGIEMTTFELATGNAVLGDCANVIDYPAIVDNLAYSSTCLQKREKPPSWLKRLFGLGAD